MLPTSAAFKTAIDSNIRTIVARARVNFSDVLLDLTANAQLETYPLRTEDGRILLTEDDNQIGIEYNIDSKTFASQLVNGRRNSTRKWASSDGVTVPNGTFFPAPNLEEAVFNELGWWSDLVSESDGTFLYPQRVSITFSPRTLNRVGFSADGNRDEYPVDANLYFFDSTDAFIQQVVVTNNTAFDRQIAIDMADVARILLEITKWNVPGRKCKITEISPIFEQIFEDQDIVSFDVVEQREIGSQSDVPTGGIVSNEADIVLINSNRIFDNNNADSPFFGNIRQNARVFLEVGVQISPETFEYVSVFNGWSAGWEVPESSIEASTSARDRLELLSRSQFSTATVIENETFSQWFERVLNDAGLTIDDYEIDSLLTGADYNIPFGWMENRSHRSALELLAQACGASVYVDRNGLIRIESLEFLARESASSLKTFTRSDYTNKDNQPIYTNLANRIVVTTSPREQSASKTVYQTAQNQLEEIAANRSQTYTIFYTEKPVLNAVPSISPAVSGLSITSSTLYSWGADIIVTSTNPTDQTFQFLVTGNTLDVLGQQVVTFEDQVSINANGLYTLEYPETQFLQTRSLAEIIADVLVRTFADPQRDLTIEFEPGGDPSLELGDPITVTDRYGSLSYNIVNTEIAYASGLSVRHQGRILTFFTQQLVTEDDRILLSEADEPLLAEFRR